MLYPLVEIVYIFLKVLLQQKVEREGMDSFEEIGKLARILRKLRIEEFSLGTSGAEFQGEKIVLEA